MYYNTVKEKSDELKKNKTKALSQDKQIWGLLALTKTAYTPFEIQAYFKDKNWPITSIRRALNTIVNNKVGIEKLEDVSKGKYGRMNHKWQYTGKTSKGLERFSK